METFTAVVFETTPKYDQLHLKYKHTLIFIVTVPIDSVSPIQMFGAVVFQTTRKEDQDI